MTPLWLRQLQDLFKKTVGPLKEVVLVYNNQGKSKGLAIVSFQKTTDAAVARTKYHGKIVDGRESHALTSGRDLPRNIGRPIKVEIIVDGDSQPSPPTTTAPTLFSRLAPPPPKSTASTTLGSRVGAPVKAPTAYG